MVSQEAQFMAGAFLVVVVAAAAADVCRWYAAPYSITLVSVKVASDFGVVFGQVCICRLCQNPTKCGQKCCCVKPTRILSAYLLWTFPFNKLVALADKKHSSEGKRHCYYKNCFLLLFPWFVLFTRSSIKGSLVTTGFCRVAAELMVVFSNSVKFCVLFVAKVCVTIKPIKSRRVSIFSLNRNHSPSPSRIVSLTSIVFM